MVVVTSDRTVETSGNVARRWVWVPLAAAVVLWPSLVAQIGALARQASSPSGVAAIRLVALCVALALPAAGVFVLLRQQDFTTPAARRLRFWAHLATIAPVLHTAMRIPQFGIPVREAWLAIFGATLGVSLLRSVTLRDSFDARAAPPPVRLLRLHRWSAAVIVTFAALHIGGHATAFVSLELNLAIVDRLRLFYKQPLFEGLLLGAAPVQVVTGLMLYRASRDRAAGIFHRLQLTSGVYLAAFIAAHTIATGILFRNITFYSATGAANGVFNDPTFMTYYVLGPVAVAAHVACALRVMLARRIGRVRAERWAVAMLGVASVVCLLIALAAAGVHVNDDRQLPGARRRPAPVRSWLASPSE